MHLNNQNVWNKLYQSTIKKVYKHFERGRGNVEDEIFGRFSVQDTNYKVENLRKMFLKIAKEVGILYGSARITRILNGQIPLVFYNKSRAQIFSVDLFFQF